MLFLGGIFYIGLLLVNAVAILSEDRFLARSACFVCHATPSYPYTHNLSFTFCSRMVVRFSTKQRRVSTKL
jgi:hypothetical protein